MHISPYSAPNSIDTVIRTEQRICKQLPIRFYRVAEVFAALQTIDDAMQEVSGKSNRRDAAIATWRELAGDLLHGASALNLTIAAGTTRPAIDPFLMARRDFPYGGNPISHCANIPNLLTLMANAARNALGSDQRYTDNYHGVIFYQLWQLRAVTKEQCVAYHDRIIRLPIPTSCARSGLVYLPDYDPDDMPRGCTDHYDISEFKGAFML